MSPSFWSYETSFYFYKLKVLFCEFDSFEKKVKGFFLVWKPNYSWYWGVWDEGRIWVYLRRCFGVAVFAARSLAMKQTLCQTQDCANSLLLWWIHHWGMEIVSGERDLHKQQRFLSVFSEALGFHKCLVWILSFKAQTCTKGQCVHSNAKLVHSGVYCKRITLGISILIFKLLLNFID